MKQNDKYTWNAKDYAKHSSAQQGWARELISKLKLKGTESVLDIGCGDGQITAEIATQLPHGKILGIDSSKDMIDLAQKKFTQLKHPNLSFKIVNAQDLQYKKEFDIVFSNTALHWVKDHRPVILGIKNSLTSQGRVLLQMGGKGNAESIISLLETIILDKEWNQYFSDFEFPYGFHDSKMYTLWLKEAGLNPIRVELIPKEMSYKDKDGLAGWIRTTWLPYTDRVPAHRKTEFINMLVEKYIKEYPSDRSGSVHVGMIRLEVEAIKNV